VKDANESFVHLTGTPLYFCRETMLPELPERRLQVTGEVEPARRCDWRPCASGQVKIETWASTRGDTLLEH
jgi:hypothetical protein